MDLWTGSLSEFVRGASTGALQHGMVATFSGYHGVPPSVPEMRSWENSLRALSDALRPMRAVDLGVTLRGVPVAADPGVQAEPAVVLEYHLPLSLRRIDVILTGRDAGLRDTAVILELKQWSAVDLEDAVATNVLQGGKEHAHPCEQAFDYAETLRGYHSAFAQDEVVAAPAAWCHELRPPHDAPLRDPRFGPLLAHSPLFVAGEEAALRAFVGERVGGGGGREVMARLRSGAFRPSEQVVASLQDTLEGRHEWHLLDEQRVAYNAILDEVRRAVRADRHAVVLVRGGPGTGKTVIAVQLLAAALANGWAAAHATGGKAFTTALRSRFKGAQDLFIWNMHTRNAAYKGLDLLLVDEAHRVRATSDTRYTPRVQRSQRSQTQELIDAARVTVFLLDEHQFVRPDEVGKTALILEEAKRLNARIKVFDLAAQFRCGGCTAFTDWVDGLLGFTAPVAPAWGDRYRVDVVDDPAALDAMMDAARDAGEASRLMAGFCWPWSDPRGDDTLVEDVAIGAWQRPWNRKASDKAYKPADHPYTRWATTAEGEGQVGCVYSVQGFEFTRVGVIWGPDLVWRDGRWVAQKQHSFDRPVKGSKVMEELVRNAYRVLLTRGMRHLSVLILDDETRAHVRRMVGGVG